MIRAGSNGQAGTSQGCTLAKKLTVQLLVFLIVFGPNIVYASNSAVDVGKTSVASGFKLSPNALDGSLQYEIPLTFPPGRNGMQPSLSLTYSSRPARETNLLGYGWSLSIPYIERRNHSGIENLYTDAAFFSSLSGNLSSTSDATVFKPQVDDGDYLQYTYSTSTGWTVKDKRGTTYTFGSASSTQVVDPNNSARVYRWMLAEVRDTNDNYVSYSYTKDSNQIYPDVINYTGHSTSSGVFDIRFTKEARNDTATSTAEGFAVTTRYRISEIKAEVSGSWVRKYVLSYTTGDNGTRDLLASVTESGYDGSSTVTLPAISFTYQNATSSWAENTSWDIPEQTVGGQYEDTGTRFADANGDGLPDLLRNDTSISKVYLNNGTGWTYNASWTLPIDLTASSTATHPGILIIDINGDGRTDIAQSLHTTSSIYLNNGSGWTLTSSTIPIEFSDADGNDAGVRVADLNGDGLADLTYRYGSDSRVYINNGATWTLDNSWSSIPEPTLATSTLDDTGVRFADFNGDGLADLLRDDSTIDKIYLNDGNKGWTATSSTVPRAFMYDNRDNGGRLDDVNGDGLTDNFDQGNVYINTGGEFIIDTPAVFPLGYIAWDGSKYVDAGTRLADINGDGFVDVLQYKYGDPDRVYIHNGIKGDLLSTVTNQQGGVTTITYTTTPQTGLSSSLPLTLDIVATLTYNDGISTWDKEYAYASGSYYTTNIRDRKFAGFNKITETDDLGFVTKQYFHQGNASASSTGEYDDHIAKIGKVYRTEVYDGSSNLYAKTINKWDRYDRGDGASFVKLGQTVDFNYDGDSDHKEKAAAFTYDNGIGVPTEKIQWGRVTGSDDGTFTDTGTDKFTTTLSYATSSTSTIAVLTQETTVDQSANKVRERKIYYDGLSLGAFNKGNPTKEEQWKTGLTYIDIEKTYNSYGLVTQEKDPRDKTTDYTYETYNLYPATTTNALAQVFGRTYDYSSGKVTQLTDSNGRVFQSVYDSLDRIKEEKQPDLSSPTSLVTKSAYTYTDTGFPKRVQKTDYLNSGTSTDSYVYLDGFGRKVQERTEAESSYVAKNYTYNSVGLVSTESLPYFSTGTGFTATSSPASSTVLISYTYDPLQRVTVIHNNLGTSTNAYDDWKLTATDAEGNIKDLSKDAFGNLVEVIEHNGTSTYTTAYEYNGNNKLTKITDAEANIRNFTYDGLGRRLTAQDLHDAGDGTYGSSTYTYDDSGNLTSVVDPKNQTVNYTYDDLNRVLTEDYTGASSTEVSYAYDTCTEGKGHLCTATSTGATVTYTYNALGLIAGETKRVSSTNYTTSRTYDRLSNPLVITHPDNSEVRYTYNTAGQLEVVAQKESGGSFADLISNFDYAPTGKISTKDFVNGISTDYTYDATKLYRLTHIQTASSSGMGGFDGFDLGYWDGEKVVYFVDEDGSTSVLDNLATFAEKAPTAPRFLIDTPVGRPAPDEERHMKAIPIGTTDLGATIYSAKIYQHDVQYLDPVSNVLADIDVRLIDSGQVWTMTKAPYAARLAKNTASKAVTFRTGETELYFSPAAADVPPVSGRKVNSDTGELIRYADALGSGVDLEVQLDTTQLRKEAVLKNTEAIQSLTAAGGFVEVPFLLEANEEIDVSDNGRLFSGSLTTGNEVEVRGASGAVAYFLPPLATDAAGNTVHIQIRYEQTSEGVRMTKLLPVAWLETAAYPVRTDTVVSYYSDLGGDGYVLKDASSNWNTVHDATVGTDNNAGATQARVETKTYSGNTYSISRILLPFDTSALPDDAVVDIASLRVYIGNPINDQDDDGNDFLRVVQNTAASPTAITNDDYDQVGAIDNPTAGATDLDISNIAGPDHKTFTLNATGRSWINLTGYTKFGLREGHDVVDDPITTGYISGVTVQTSETNGTTYDPYLQITYHSNGAPTAPTSLLTEGATNPTDITDTTPEFSAIYQDPNATDTAASYQINVSTASDFSSIFWDSTKTTLSSSTTAGSRTPDLSYAGQTLIPGTTYYWRIKLWDDDDAAGSWSTSTATFSLLFSGSIQDIYYTYDAVGNITTLNDYSGTGAGKSIAFGYDDINRLISASTTAASSTPFNQTYAYSSIGNITNKSDQGAYSYLETGSTNPQAVTTIGSMSLAYDTNGNLTSMGSSTYSWDYRNRLTSAYVPSATTTYAYDHTTDRVKKTIGATSTIYANDLYNTDGTTKIKHIYAGEELIATITTVGSTSTKQYIHSDHLGGTNVTTNASGTVTQVLDYYPYGSERISVGSGEQRTFIGEEYDSEADLSYLNARYYTSAEGKFISQDPVFLGDPKSQNLDSPQSLNSYSYAGGNPITQKDPTGRDYVDYNGAFTVPVFGIPVGPTMGIQAGPGSDDPVVYFGIAVSRQPGPSGSVTYSKDGSPAEGASVSISGFGKGVGIQGSYGESGFSLQPGVGTRGLGGSLVFGVKLSKIAALGGPFENITTPMMASNIQNAGPALMSPSNSSFKFMSNQHSATLNSVNTSLKAAGAAISKGDYKAASKYLNGASRSLNKINQQ